MRQIQVMVGMLCMFIGTLCARSAITPVDSSTQLQNPVTVGFDGHPDHSIANRLFLDQGVLFTRDDGAPIYLLDWTALNRSTTSPANVLATVLRFFPEETYVTHLNVLPVEPVFAMGAYFGNDQAEADFASIRMSAYGLDGRPLGSTQVAANNNTSVDQFIGLSSDAPIAWVRFDNLNSAGGQSQNYSVVIDDLMFVPVPEPSTVVLGGVGLLMTALALGGGRKKSNHRKT